MSLIYAVQDTCVLIRPFIHLTTLSTGALDSLSGTKGAATLVH